MTASTVLVTGANGDIARIVINEALAKGKKVFATVRNKAHFNTFPENPNLQVFLMDITDPDSIKTGFEKLDTLLNDELLDAVIHCAAIAIPRAVEMLPLDELEQHIKTNTLGAFSIMQASFPRLRKSHGKLVISSSVWGQVSGPMVGAYSASKHALEALVIAARQEMLGMGFHIVLVNIGAVKSRMLHAHGDEIFKQLREASSEEQKLYAHMYKYQADLTLKLKNLVINAETVGKRLVEIADKTNPAPRYKIGTDAKLLCFLNWFLPARWMDNIMGIKKK